MRLAAIALMAASVGMVGCKPITFSKAVPNPYGTDKCAAVDLRGVIQIQVRDDVRPQDHVIACQRYADSDNWKAAAGDPFCMGYLIEQEEYLLKLRPELRFGESEPAK
jgi:hypothetical protein